MTALLNPTKEIPIRPSLERRDVANISASVPQADAEAMPASDQAEIPFGPILKTSVLVTTLVMLFAVGVPMWLLTGQIWDGIGLGVFTAFWGGPGFGVMAAGARWTALQERG